MYRVTSGRGRLPGGRGGRKVSGSQGLTPGTLLGEPDGIQLVVEVVARRDLPALDLARVGNDPLPLERQEVVDLLVEEALLELADQRLALLRVGGPRLLLVEVVQHPVGVAAVVRRVLSLETNL